jgi:hypothetical protein
MYDAWLRQARGIVAALRRVPGPQYLGYQITNYAMHIGEPALLFITNTLAHEVIE